MCVVTFAVSSRVRYGPAPFYRAIALNNVVIANIAETSSEVYLLYLFCTKRAAGTIRRAMNDDFVYQSHLLLIVLAKLIVCVYAYTEETPRVYQAL